MYKIVYNKKKLISRGVKMGGIFGKIFDTRTKEDKQRDFENYSNLIFPYGEEQKEKIFGILDELLPKQNKKYLRMHYILLKDEMIQQLSFAEANAKIAKKTLLKTNPNINSIVKTLLEADLGINDKLEYPSIEEINKIAKEII